MTRQEAQREIAAVRVLLSDLYHEVRRGNKDDACAAIDACADMLMHIEEGLDGE